MHNLLEEAGRLEQNAQNLLNSQKLQEAGSTARAADALLAPCDHSIQRVLVRSAIQQIAVEHRRRYGYRRIAAELRRRGMLVNHKRVASVEYEQPHPRHEFFGTGVTSS